MLYRASCSACNLSESVLLNLVLLILVLLNLVLLNPVWSFWIWSFWLIFCTWSFCIWYLHTWSFCTVLLHLVFLHLLLLHLVLQNLVLLEEVLNKFSQCDPHRLRIANFFHNNFHPNLFFFSPMQLLFLQVHFYKQSKTKINKEICYIYSGYVNIWSFQTKST